MNLDKTDLRILDHLQRDGSLSNVELARKIAVVRPGLGVILATGRLDRSELASAEDAPFVAHLEKPFTIERLSEALRTLLARAGTTAHAAKSKAALTTRV